MSGGDILFLTVSGGSGSYTLNAREGLASTQNLGGGAGNDTLNGSSGTDVLNGAGGVNVLNGNGGDDVLLLINAKDGAGVLTSLTGAGSSFNGGTGNDTLSIGGFVDFQGTLSSIEAIDLQAAYTSPAVNGAGSQAEGYLLIMATRLAGSPAALALSGTGTIEIDATDRSSYDISAFQFLSGAAVGTVLDLGEGNGTIVGSSGDDTIYFGAGNKTVTGGAGSDIFAPALGQSIITDFVFGTDSLDLGTGIALHDRISDFVADVGGNIVLSAVLGGQTFSLTLQGVTLALAEGADGTLITGPEESVVTSGTELVDTIFGMSLNDFISTQDGDDLIYTGGGLDTIDAGAGNDRIYVDGVVTLGGAYQGGSGTDVMILRTLDVTTPGPAGPVSTFLFGNGSGASTFGGIEQLQFQSSTGEAMNAQFTYAQLAGSLPSVQGGAGTDSVAAWVSGGGTFTMPNYTLIGWSQGTSYLQTQDTLGLLAADGANYTLIAREGLASMQNLVGNSGNDVLQGSASFDQLIGNAGDDALFGGGGNDRMIGGGGDDSYYVESIGDVVIEGNNVGYDTIYTDISLTIAANVERLAARDSAGTAALILYGSASANSLIGNAGANVLDGLAGADSMIGLGGNDVYFVDNSGDDVVEALGGGYDTVFANADYRLGDNVERVVTLDPSATAAINFTGNALDNEMTGNAGANILDGGVGADLMIGGAGDDVYFVDNTGDVVSDAPGGGYDTVFTSTNFLLTSLIERVVAVDGNATTAITLTGNEFDNEITGNAGTNQIDGKTGSDLLVGGGGADAFVFSTTLGANNIDSLPDFVVGQDRIYLDHSIFAAIAAGALSAGAFKSGSAATDADDRIIYDPVTGKLYSDADGNGAGAAVQFAVLHEGLNLTAADFHVI